MLLLDRQPTASTRGTMRCSALRTIAELSLVDPELADGVNEWATTAPKTHVEHHGARVLTPSVATVLAMVRQAMPSTGLTEAALRNHRAALTNHVSNSCACTQQTVQCFLAAFAEEHKEVVA